MEKLNEKENNYYSVISIIDDFDSLRRLAQLRQLLNLLETHQAIVPEVLLNLV